MPLMYIDDLDTAIQVLEHYHNHKYIFILTVQMILIVLEEVTVTAVIDGASSGT